MTLKDFYITSNMSLYFIYKYYKNNNLYILTKFISFNNKCGILSSVGMLLLYYHVFVHLSLYNSIYSSTYLPILLIKVNYT